MKLVGSLLCVAAVSVVGCADVETTGGGQMEGISPEKVSFVDPETLPAPLNPPVAGLKQIGTPEPADVVCDGCLVTAFRIPDDRGQLDEVRVVSDRGLELCRIYLKDDQVVMDECGWLNP